MTGSKQATVVEIKPPNLQTIAVEIEGTAPFVQNKFSAKAKAKMHADQEAGPTAKGKKQREPKDFQACFDAAQHRSAQGWAGIPAPAFRSALISACRVVGFAMTRAKLAVFCEPDGFDVEDGTPLVRITKGEPVYHEAYVRNDDGSTDLRARAMWREGWRAVVRLTYDADMFQQNDIVNLLARAGLQVGVGEGRPDSRKSAGMGWGTFRILGEGE